MITTAKEQLLVYDLVQLARAAQEQVMEGGGQRDVMAGYVDAFGRLASLLDDPGTYVPLTDAEAKAINDMIDGGWDEAEAAARRFPDLLA